MTVKQRRQALGFGAALAAFMLFAGHFVLSKRGLAEGMTPYDILALRLLVAGSFAWFLLAGWGVRDLAGIGWTRGTVLALVAGVPYFLLVLLGVRLAPAANAVVINPGMTLIGGMILAALFLREQIGAKRAIAALLALAGLVLISRDVSDLFHLRGVLTGNALFAIAGLLWALYMMLLGRWQVEPLRGAAVVSALSLVYLPAYLAFAPTGLAHTLKAEIVLQLVYQGGVHAFLAMALFGFAVRTLGAATVALITPVVPTTGLALAAILLNETLEVAQIFGALLICLALVTAALAVRSDHRTR